MWNAWICMDLLLFFSFDVSSSSGTSISWEGSEWFSFWLLSWGLDSCSSLSTQRKALLWSKRAKLGVWTLLSFLFCIENRCGYALGWQDQTLAILPWDKDAVLIRDYLRPFGCWYCFSIRSGNCLSHDKREVRWENTWMIMGLGPLFIR